MNNYLGIISPIGVIGIILLYFMITLSSVYYIFRREKGLSTLLWILFVLFIPFIGGIIYLSKYFIEKKISQDIEEI